jgi:hypothetical protein
VRFAAAAALALLAAAGDAAAHGRGASYSEWTLSAQADGTVRAEVRAHMPQLELTRLALHPEHTPDYAARAAAWLAGQLQLWSSAGRCAPGEAAGQAASDGGLYARWTARCAGGGELRIVSTLPRSVEPSHLHFARARFEGGAPAERALSRAEPAFALGAPPGAAASFARYVALGVEHILSGWDHLAFVLALILLAGSLREVVFVATGFTLAHSLTLAAAVLGWAQARADAVEALIGFSIALVAAENLWLRAGRERWLPLLAAGALGALALLGAGRLPAATLAGLALFTACYFALARQAARPLRLRVAVAFGFGLVHGFGFAGALAPLQLPAGQAAAGLLGFNLGVELGQLLVVALAWPLLALLSRRPAARAWTGDTVSAGLCAAGVFWFVVRAFA